MWIAAGIIAAASFFAYLEVPLLIKAKMKKELWVFSILLLIGTMLSIAVSFDMVVPNPLDLIYLIFKPMSQVLDAWLKG
ncbi:hypothetical protein D3P08_01760 [Paenibacillus nanensis]|uniref:Uncharacterized protein n=1 Tax=Paenibacillus nanensis TaxID=393251 RepID=A0A3A1VHC4_9BACL|nr:hypothetical protein [Paenibacillus nanensis]RIX60319.1 hypothetical protein D3P08_01760 [Paenibacillus nanensis]